MAWELVCIILKSSIRRPGLGENKQLILFPQKPVYRISESLLAVGA